jgi:HAD superfamily hydrolase (TIGR01459 family)
MAAVSENYDAFILDVWGVLHDGVALFPGVVNTLEKLKDAGKQFVMLTNAPRRSDAVAEAMIAMGMPSEFCRHILSSGEATFLDMKERTDPFYEGVGNRCIHIGPDRDLNLFEDLQWETTQQLDAADLIVNTGPWEDGETVADYEDRLATGISFGLPMICANPDLEVVRGGKKIVCAGALALRYEEMGGIVRWFGKPKAEIYEYCFRVLGGFDKKRIAAVGDSFRTDLAGARNAGVDPVLVASGIHAVELGDPPAAAAIAALGAKWNALPAVSVSAFTW